MEKLKKSILDVMEAYKHIPFSTLVKNENAHRSILLGIEKATELFSDSTSEQIKYEVHDILTEVGLAKAEIDAYKEIDPPEYDGYYHDFLTGNDYIVIPNIVFDQSDVPTEYEEEGLPF